jgi:hypothetical protein
MLGGYMEIDSATGQGAKIMFQVPCLITLSDSQPVL